MNDAAHSPELQALAAEARGGPGKTKRPVDAATLIILDRTGPAPRVLMGRRHANHRFMPDVFVFPGGRSETGDARIPDAGALSEETSHLLAQRNRFANASRIRRLALAAIRETFEETGIVIGQKAQAPGALAGPWGDFAATGHLPDLSTLSFVARAITPPRRPKRFDTRFFTVDAKAIVHQVPGIVTAETELTELAWLTFAETEAQPLPAITRIMLKELQGHLEALERGEKPVIPFYFERHRKMQRETIPA